MSVTLLFLVFFTLSLPLGCSSLSLSFLFLPLASPSFLPNVTDALAVAPALCAPACVARAMASDFHANLNVAAGVVSGTLTACGSTLFAVWGALPKRRGNAGSDSELPHHLNTFLEVRWDCVFASALTLALSPSLSLSVQLLRLSLHATGRAFPAISPLLFVFAFAFSSSSSYLLPLCTSFLFFFTSASSSCCFSSLLSSSSHGLPAQLLGGVNDGSRTKGLSSNVALCCEAVRRRE